MTLATDVEVHAVRTGTVVIGQIDAFDFRVVISPFRRVHNLELFVIKPRHRQFHGCARGSLQHRRHRAIARQMRCIDDIEIFEARMLDRNRHFVFADVLLIKTARRAVRANSQDRRPAFGQTEVEIRHVSTLPNIRPAGIGIGIAPGTSQSRSAICHLNSCIQLIGPAGPRPARWLR